MSEGKRFVIISTRDVERNNVIRTTIYYGDKRVCLDDFDDINGIEYVYRNLAHVLNEAFETQLHLELAAAQARIVELEKENEQRKAIRPTNLFTCGKENHFWVSDTFAQEDCPVCKLEAQNKVILEALVNLLDPFKDDPCYYDHHGYCQAHFVSNPCPVEAAKEAIAAIGKETK